MSSDRAERVNTQSFFLRPPFRVPRTKPPMSLMASCWALGIFLNSANVSAVTLVWKMRSRNSSSSISDSLHFLSIRLLPIDTLIFIATSPLSGHGYSE